MHTTVTANRVFAAAVWEYLPARLSNGRLTLAGDAAHTASPITGAGARNALIDALALEAGLTAAGDDVRAALIGYERERLGPARALVEGGRRWGRELTLGRA